jgi:hypothetical protein
VGWVPGTRPSEVAARVRGPAIRKTMSRDVSTPLAGTGGLEAPLSRPSSQDYGPGSRARSAKSALASASCVLDRDPAQRARRSHRGVQGTPGGELPRREIPSTPWSSLVAGPRDRRGSPLPRATSAVRGRSPQESVQTFSGGLDASSLAGERTFEQRVPHSCFSGSARSELAAAVRAGGGNPSAWPSANQPWSVGSVLKGRLTTELGRSSWLTAGIGRFEARFPTGNPGFHDLGPALLPRVVLGAVYPFVRDSGLRFSG